MRVALIGDIHANLPALEAVLAHAQAQHVDQIWNIGDFVGYGAFPDQVVSRVRELNILSIRGNYDRKVLDYPRKHKKWEGKKAGEKILAFGWAYEHLSGPNLDYLADLPEERILAVEGWQVLLTHASPVSANEHLCPTTPESRLQEIARERPVQVAIFGHSHQAFARKAGGTWFINTGSVGRPDDGDPRACYAFLLLEPGSLGVCHFRVTYDVQHAADAITQQHLPDEFARMILSGHNFDKVKADDD